MIYNYLFHETAQKDYEDALSWYLGKSERVGTNFFEAVDDTLKLICDTPTRWRNEYKNYFELNLKNFPTQLFIQLRKREI